MEALIFLHHKHMWDWNIAIRVRSYTQDDKKVIVIGPHERTKVLEQTIKRWTKINGIDEIAWMDGMKAQEMIDVIRFYMNENDATSAVIISEDVKHEAVAEAMEIEFVRAFDWMN